MTKQLAVAFPILPGKKDQWKKFSNDLNNKYKKEYTESRKNLGVQERAFLQSTPNGEMVIVTLEGENPEAAISKFGESKDEFSKWFNQQVKEIHGVDFTEKQKGPLSELVNQTEPVKEHVES